MTERISNPEQTPQASSEPRFSTDCLDAAVDLVSARYTRLLLVVGTPDSSASAAVHQLAAKLECPVVNVGLDLARTLLEVPQRRRPVAAADAAADICRGNSSDGKRVLDHIEVLFQHELHLDPLKIMQDAARNRVVVALWPGEWTGTSLRYAAPAHLEFREYHNPDCLVVETPASSTKDRS